MSWQSEAAARYGAVAAGLMIGTAAKLGLTLGEGRPVTLKSIVIELSLMGLLGLEAVIVSERMGLTGDMRAFVAAMMALSSERTIKLIRKTYESVSDQKAGQFVQAATAGDVIKVPKGTGIPDSVTVEVIQDDTPAARVGSILRRAHKDTTKATPPRDMTERLNRLD